MVAVYWIFQRAAPARVDRVFRVAQLASSALFSFSHGANDAQKTMGIIVGLLGASHTQELFRGQTGWLGLFYLPNPDAGVPYWVEIGTPRILVNPKIAIAAAVSAENPPTGWRRVMPLPIVFTIRHPPNIVPRAIAA